LIRFIIAMAGLACFCLLTLYLVSPFRPSYAVPTTILVMLTNLVIYKYLRRQTDPQFFVQMYLATMAFKLLIFGAYVFTIAFLDRADATENVVYFLSVYVLFLGVEIGFLFRQKNR
jgi:hypothetical protein